MNDRPKADAPRTVVAPNGKLEEKETVVVKKSIVRRVFPWLLLAILAVGAVYGWNILQFNKTHETTDDAQIDADINPVISRLSGYVEAISAEDNQKVKTGDVLVTHDAKDLQVKLQSAEAAYQSALAAVTSARSAAAASEANIRTAEVAEHKTAQDLTRDEQLLTGNAITEQQMLSTRSAHETAAAQLASVRQQATAVLSQIAVSEAQVALRKAVVDNVKLQMSYATITAPSDGTVAKKNVQVGEFIQAGQPLMAITPSDVWITANFKETQIAEIKPGAPVSFEVDAYPDYEFHGSVGSISPATGAKFALLPPDNASGNYVKVVQRIPVRIHVDNASVKGHPLRPGMSVDVTVTTGK
jgi:membrane fusion protein (multidrug efflux system)